MLGGWFLMGRERAANRPRLSEPAKNGAVTGKKVGGLRWGGGWWMMGEKWGLRWFYRAS